MRKPKGFWGKCRTVFRHFRQLIILAVVLLMFVVVWLNRMGLPDFVKRPLVETLRSRGIDLEFSRLRLSFLRGLVATDVHIGQAENGQGPTLSLRQMQVRLDYPALLHRRLQVDGLVLRQGKLVWPISPTNALELDKIQSDLRFQTNDTWSLDNFRADFAGTKLMLSGDITHAGALRDWKIFHGPPVNPAAQRFRWRQFSDLLQRIHFSGTPQLSLTVRGDAREPRSFHIHLLATVPDADTPWGSVQAIGLTARLGPTGTSASPGPPEVYLSATIPAATTPWGSADAVHLTARLAAPPGAPAKLDAFLGWWTNLQPYSVDWNLQVADLTSPKLNAQTIRCAGYWHAPELVVTNLTAGLGGGQLDAGARLRLDSREFSFTNSSCFDPRAIEALLTEKTRNWLGQFSWTQPLALRVEGSLILPPWTNRQPDWRGAVQPTVQLAGSFAATNGAFRGIAVDAARGHFSYSNLVWRLSNLAVKRSEGTLRLADVEDDRTRDFHWHVAGALAPDAIQPLLAETHAEGALAPFTFKQPLRLNADIWGRLNDDNSLAAAGFATLTNFTIHGEAVSSVESAFDYTNRVIEFLRPRLQAGAQRMKADGITVDFNSWRVYFTNGFSTVDPQAVARAIGPIPGAVLAPYHFGVPCPARVNGYAPLRGSDDADIWFESDGAPFAWLRLKTPRLAGQIHWMGQTLILTNLTAAFYGGNAQGFAHFDFRARYGADFDFIAGVQNVDVHALAADLSSPTNHLEGLLSGRFVMTSANSQNWRTWNGYGQADLRNGLIWDVPIFGILSAPLNAITPGLGNSRATEAKAQFGMTNGVMFSDNLEIRTRMMRLQYNGTVDLQNQVNAHVTAQLLRDTWVVGPLLSTALWPVSKLFEYKITGTLQQPKMKPVYIPKILLTPLHPFRSLEDILDSTNSSASPFE